MRKLALAAGLAAAVTGASSWAGGIQIAIEGDGDVGNSVFVSPSIGNTEGNSLLDGAIVGSAGGPTSGGVWRGHNSFDISSFTGFAAELTIDFDMTVDVALINGPSTAVGALLSVTQTPATVATMRVYYDDFGRVDSDIVAGIAGDPLSGLGYTDGTLVASGAMTLGGAFTISNLSGAGVGPISTTNATPTITTSGGTTVGVDFTAGLNLAYVVNKLASAIVDMSTANSLTTPYDGVANPFPPTSASTSFSGGGVLPSYGSDGTNDFDCGGVFELCDFQSQMNTTVLFTADQVPEPASLALLGLGLTLIGRRSLLARK